MKPPAAISARTRKRAAHLCELAASCDGDPGYENIAEFVGFGGEHSPEVLLAYAAWFHQSDRLPERTINRVREGVYIDWCAFEAEVAEFLRDGGMPNRDAWRMVAGPKDEP